MTARRWRGEGYKRPLVLSRPQIRRILERRATTLILRRSLRRGSYDVHDSATIQRNEAHCKSGRPDLQRDPHAFTIEITDISRSPTEDIDYRAARAAGYETSDQVRADHHGTIHIHTFKMTAARYLHRDPARGYTTDVNEAAADEPQALSVAELDELTRRAEARHQQRQADHRTNTPLPDRVRSLELAASQGDQQAQRHLFVIKQRIEAAERKRGRAA